MRKLTVFLLGFVVLLSAVFHVLIIKNVERSYASQVVSIHSYVSFPVKEKEQAVKKNTELQANIVDENRVVKDQEVVYTNTINEPVVEVDVRDALFANGCFWCVEADLEKVPGVIEVISGYGGGTNENPTYDDYARTGHREIVKVTYDNNKVSYANLVEHILKHGNPTDSEGSFGDRGQEYAPAIYYETDREQKLAEQVIARVNQSGVFSEPLTIPVIADVIFWPAELYHQDYAKNNTLKYFYYRTASGRTSFIEDTWGRRATIFEFSL